MKKEKLKELIREVLREEDRPEEIDIAKLIKEGGAEALVEICKAHCATPIWNEDIEGWEIKIGKLFIVAEPKFKIDFPTVQTVGMELFFYYDEEELDIMSI